MYYYKTFSIKFVVIIPLYWKQNIESILNKPWPILRKCIHAYTGMAHAPFLDSSYLKISRNQINKMQREKGFKFSLLLLTLGELYYFLKVPPFYEPLRQTFSVFRFYLLIFIVIAFVRYYCHHSGYRRS